MKIKIILGFLLMSIVSYGAENSIKGVVMEKENPQQPIVGANIYWRNTTQGTTTNTNGEFEIAKPEGAHMLVSSFVGYNTEISYISSDKILEIFLSKNLELGEVLIQERQKGQYISSLSPLQTAKVTASELQKAACCNLAESFETNASVDVSFSDAVTGAKQIKMLGLSGIYVQTIAENMPSIRGMASPYGLGYIPGSWMESIQISKGTSSVLNGYEAVSGQINVEYKKPFIDEILHVNLYGNDAEKTEANLNYAYQFNDSLSTMILLHAENHSKEIDDNNDSFLDMPHIQQINFMNRWYKTTKDGGDIQLAIKILDEHRKSGQVGTFNNVNSNLYGIDINTNRYEFFSKAGFLLNRVGTSIGFQLSGSYHNQDAFYGAKEYKGTQYNTYFNLIYQGNFGTDLHTYKTGVSFLGDLFNESHNNEMTHRELVPGAYFEYNFHLKEKFNLLAGIRTDYSSLYGVFVTPRIHAKWDITNWLALRVSAGKGYRTSIPLAENSYLLASSRAIISDEHLKQEEAINMGSSLIAKIPLGEKEMTLMIDYYRTNFLNQVVRDVDSDVHQVRFMNLDGKSYSNSFQAELLYEIVKGLTVNAAYRINDVKQTINGELREMPLTSRYKGMLSLSYATRLDKWQFDLTSQFNGGGRMPDPSVKNALWKEEFAPFTILNAQITKNYKNWSFYVGSENLSNFSMENPIIASNDPWGNDFDGSMIWGPIHGRKIYFGLRYTLKNYK
jgi:outer membrane receptor for ferrienterochelin and colicins